MTTTQHTPSNDERSNRASEVIVVIGAGGIGQAIGRRHGSGRTVLLADLNDDVLAGAVEAVEAAGTASPPTVSTSPRAPRSPSWPEPPPPWAA
jgi:threonine dehydrogenase-like Zn-dependent dehydrogenase